MKIKNDKIFIQIVCLVISIGLWVVVMVDTNPLLEDTINSVPINIKNLQALENSNMVLMNSDKDNLTVNVRVKGYGEQLNNLSKSSFTAYIDVLGFGEGTTNAKIEVVGPDGLEIDSYYPTQIACKVESIISKVMDVTVQYQGSQAKDYYRAYGVSNPSSVKITGPRSVVDSAKLAVATINVDGAKDAVVKTVPVRVYNGTDTEIFMSVPTDNVEVTVPIYPTKYVNLTPNIIGTPLNGYELSDVTVKPDKVRIAAKQDILNTVKELQLEDLDITGAYNNILSSKEIINDKGLILLDLNTKPVVNAVIEKIVQRELTYKLSNAEVLNLDNKYKAILPQDMDIVVTIEGPDSLINDFTKNDLKLSLDFTNAELGINKINIKGTTDKNLKNITYNTETIDVEIVQNETNQTDDQDSQTDNQESPEDVES